MDRSPRNLNRIGVLLLSAITGICVLPSWSQAAEEKLLPPTRIVGFQWKTIPDLVDVEGVFPSSVDPDVVFVWTRNGLFVSRDAGATYRPVSARRDDAATLGYVTSLLVSPCQPRILYAGTAEKGVFASYDEGATWIALGGPDRGLASLHIHSLFFAHDDPAFTTIYAAHSTAKAGISLTIDGGRTWRSFARKFHVNDFAIARDTMIIAGIQMAEGGSPGFFRAIDCGRNWWSMGNLDNPTVITPSKINHDRFWLGTEKRLQVTDDFGTSLRRQMPGPDGAKVVSLLTWYSTPDSEAVYVYDPTGNGVVVSTDNFKTWQKINDGLYVGPIVAEGAMMDIIADGSALYIAMNGRLLKGCAPPGRFGLRSARAQPSVIVPGRDNLVITCRADAGASISLNAAAVGVNGAISMLDNGQSNDGRAGDGIYGAVVKVPADFLNKNQRLPGQFFVTLNAGDGGSLERRTVPLFIVAETQDKTLWNGDPGEILTDGKPGPVEITRCSDRPHAGTTHLRVSIKGEGSLSFTWKKKDDRGDNFGPYKILSFFMRSDKDGPSKLRLCLLDDGQAWNMTGSSAEVSLSSYIQKATDQYQLVKIPLADFKFGSDIRPDAVKHIKFIAPENENRTYDMDDFALWAQPK